MTKKHTRRGSTQEVVNAVNQNKSYWLGIRSVIFHIPSRCSNLIEVLNRNDFKHPLHTGFTLIELLVVVLIIGILAAVALPQYQKAVNKARTTQFLAFLDAYQKALDLYILENGPQDIVFANSTGTFDNTLQIAYSADTLKEMMKEIGGDGSVWSIWCQQPTTEDNTVCQLEMVGGNLDFAIWKTDTWAHGVCQAYSDKGLALCVALKKKGIRCQDDRACVGNAGNNCHSVC